MKSKNLSFAGRAPAPCVVYRPDANGDLRVAATVVREPLRAQSGYEPERVARRLRVVCLQETGEEQLIGYADCAATAEGMISRHMSGHPEHSRAWTEHV